ncbi:hypothetical protein TNCV_1663951 [Trichonephila clavipes]|uniref:Uncharacterized protein n=1 Tax=Trichonephila clavipes TaxID=2585209 RepID=A0A8X6RTK9_TRICX|nr:hypothetical protein TNCV_1663951 [Trichonephila clavipes]
MLQHLLDRSCRVCFRRRINIHRTYRADIFDFVNDFLHTVIAETSLIICMFAFRFNDIKSSTIFALAAASVSDGLPLLGPPARSI